MNEIRLLTPEDIDVRIQSVNKGGARLLLYKNARVDMAILDETFGPLNWQRSHSRDNQNCTVSVWDEGKKEWVSKEDTGTDSFTEPEKGRASDSFKRACFNWGIGRELYTAPDIFVFNAELKTFKASGEKYTCFDKFRVEDIQYQGRNISKVVIRNENTGKALTFGEKKAAAPKRQNAKKPEPAVSVENIEKLKAVAANKGVSLSLAMMTAGVASLDDITPEEYNEVVRVLRGM